MSAMPPMPASLSFFWVACSKASSSAAVPCTTCAMPKCAASSLVVSEPLRASCALCASRALCALCA